jgi:S-adenosylmethionine/arginine decarboxylase-like enzyme
MSHDTITDNDLIRKIALKAIKKSGAKIYGIPKSDVWLPHGLQFYVTITTSHAIFTTYPEEDYLTVNFATCGKVDFDKFLSVLLRELKPTKIIRQYITERYPQ